MKKVNDYLTWFKDLDVRLQHSKDAHLLMSSNVYEPLDELEQDIRAHGDELRALQSHNNDWGHPVLIERIAARYGVKPRNILLTNGCTNATYLATLAQVKAGDEVVCETPAYQLMWQTADFLGARIKWLKRRPPGYGVDPEELARLVGPRTALVALTNLHNPSGAGLNREELRGIAAAVRRKNKRARILVDEVFRDFVPDAPACKSDPMFISTGSLSKVYGLSHLECGWILADSKTIGRLWPLFVMAEGNGSRYLESLSAVVFGRLDEYLRRSQGIVASNRRELCAAVEPLILEGLVEGNVPEQGCIWFPRIARDRSADAFVETAERAFGTYVVPGKFFGDPSRVRVGFGGRPELVKPAVARLAEAMVAFARRR
ncbi:MAG TPA: pyridoxal phosphate-dependent aminotransferase, partial [Candidatus Edwardsbacteria bacterium]|nr:pyridoxal phosphate-dependent aminotransferase [Candidatus Edwardsbacteria bacterium]